MVVPSATSAPLSTSPLRHRNVVGNTVQRNSPPRSLSVAEALNGLGEVKIQVQTKTLELQIRASEFSILFFQPQSSTKDFHKAHKIKSLNYFILLILKILLKSWFKTKYSKKKLYLCELFNSCTNLSVMCTVLVSYEPSNKTAVQAMNLLSMIKRC